MEKYSVVADGDVVIEGLCKGHAEGVAHGLRQDGEYDKVTVVPHDPDDPNDGPAALKALLSF